MQTLTNDQAIAIEALSDLYVDNHPFLVISGAAGTGKSTLIQHFLTRVVPKLDNGLKVIGEKPKPIYLTATTNKAAQALHSATKHVTKTIHAALGIRLNKGKLVYPIPIKRTHTIYIIDEFSYLDERMLKHLEDIRGKGTSFVFIGDPCQLTPINQNSIPVVDRKYPTVYLNELVRQETTVLKDISEQLREFVKGGPFPDLVPDDDSFVYYDGPNAEDDFIDAMIQAFQKGSAKFISYTNKRVEEINKFMLEEMHNKTTFDVGDMAINNSYVQTGKVHIKVDEIIHIDYVANHVQTISTTTGSVFNFNGQMIHTKGHRFFLPDSYEAFKRIKELDPAHLTQKDIYFQECTADFRTEYACTVHKSQGSTYDEVFIDLNDFRSIQSDKALSRLLYVALTRTKKKLHIIGDL